MQEWRSLTEAVTTPHCVRQKAKERTYMLLRNMVRRPSADGNLNASFALSDGLKKARDSKKNTQPQDRSSTKARRAA